RRALHAPGGRGPQIDEDPSGRHPPGGTVEPPLGAAPGALCFGSDALAVLVPERARLRSTCHSTPFGSGRREHAPSGERGGVVHSTPPSIRSLPHPDEQESPPCPRSGSGSQRPARWPSSAP